MAKKLKSPSIFPGFIDIKSVGVGRMTELIARKNPIPTYKPPPSPDNTKQTLYPCYECGDTFKFEQSRRIHANRVSMRLQYHCEKCNKLVKFSNKCQLLGHLRSHLDHDQPHAVPIHIKSDSVHIKSLYDELEGSKEFQWYEEVKVLFTKNKTNCCVCGQVYSPDQSRLEHLQRQKDVGPPPICKRCPMRLPNNCSLALHTNLHRLFDGDDIITDMICPECGTYFRPSDSDLFYEHLVRKCAHSSRCWSYECEKCNVSLMSAPMVRQHLMSHLEIYYKCTACPMAHKQLSSFAIHYQDKHGSVDDAAEHVKMIYRCHICDTLIDDRTFLLSHIEKHVDTYKEKGTCMFYCKSCEVFRSQRSQMTLHFKKSHQGMINSRTCTHCRGYVFFNNSMELFAHSLEMHQEILPKEEAAFCKCGLVCTDAKILANHLCFLKTGPGGWLATMGHPSTPQSKLADKQQSKPEAIQQNKTTSEMTHQKGDPLWKQQLLPQKPEHSKKQLAVPLTNNLECPMCGRECLNLGIKRSHISKFHRSRGEYICLSCDRMDFENYYDLRNHEIVCKAKEKMHKTGSTCQMSIKAPQKNSAKERTKSDSDEDTEKNFGKVKLNLNGVTRQNSFVDRGETFGCTKCSMAFSRQSKLTEHINAEHSLHACHLCGVMYESISILKKHLLISHKGQKPVYYCWVCRGRKIEKSYSERASLERHLSLKHRMKIWDESKLVAEWPREDVKAGTSADENKVETGSVLNSSSEDEPPLKRLKVEGDNIFRCAKCLFTCESKDDFCKHITQHRTQNTIQCYECGLCFTVFPSLQRHLFMVHKIHDFKSYVKENGIEEPKEMESLDLIEREPQVVTVSSEEPDDDDEEEDMGNPGECKVCYRQFESEHLLRQHMRVHGMAFIRKSRRRHMSNKQKVPEIEVEIDNAEMDVETEMQNEVLASSNTAPLGEDNLGSSLVCQAKTVDDLKIKIFIKDKNVNL